MRLRIRLDELLPAKTAARELPRALRRLESGEAEQLVITNRNEPRAVLITVERDERLTIAFVLLLRWRARAQWRHGSGQPGWRAHDRVCGGAVA